MTKTSESVLFLFSPPMQACYSLSSAPTVTIKIFSTTMHNDIERKLISSNHS